MENLVTISNNEVVVSSRQIAENFNKRHDHVLRDITTMEKDLPNFGEMFLEDTSPDAYGREQKVYLMNRDGFVILTMGFTGKAAMDWKIKYINAFNEMEKQLKTGNAKPLTESQEKRYAVMERNAKIKEAALWAKLAADSYRIGGIFIFRYSV